MYNEILRQYSMFKILQLRLDGSKKPNSWAFRLFYLPPIKLRFYHFTSYHRNSQTFFMF